MRKVELFLATTALLGLISLPAVGQTEPAEVRDPSPIAAFIAATGSLVFAPVRLAVTAVGAGLGGLTGFLTAGDLDAANDVWGLFDGQQMLRPSIVQGVEPLQLGQLEFDMRIIEPGY